MNQVLERVGLDYFDLVLVQIQLDELKQFCKRLIVYNAQSVIAQQQILQAGQIQKRIRLNVPYSIITKVKFGQVFEPVEGLVLNKIELILAQINRFQFWHHRHRGLFDLAYVVVGQK